MTRKITYISVKPNGYVVKFQNTKSYTKLTIDEFRKLIKTKYILLKRIYIDGSTIPAILCVPLANKTIYSMSIIQLYKYYRHTNGSGIIFNTYAYVEDIPRCKHKLIKLNNVWIISYLRLSFIHNITPRNILKFVSYVRIGRIIPRI